MSKITERLYQYYRSKYIEYRNKVLSERECEFDTYKIEHDNQFVCGIDNGFCHRDTCTKNFNKYGCMYLKW